MKGRQNNAIVVGRAGHDPATYGLKGRANGAESSTSTDERERREPTVVQVGDVVEITSGLRKGQRGVVLELRDTTFFGAADLAVQFEDGMVRVIRADFVRRMRGPEHFAGAE
jgi:transcription antitermination factor NusG